MTIASDLILFASLRRSLEQIFRKFFFVVYEAIPASPMSVCSLSSTPRHTNSFQDRDSDVQESPSASSSIDALLDQIVMDMRGAAALIDRLHDEGYHANFILCDSKLVCLQNHHTYFTWDLAVDQIYRIDDAEIGIHGLYIYALRLPGEDLRGVYLIQTKDSSAK